MRVAVCVSVCAKVCAAVCVTVCVAAGFVDIGARHVIAQSIALMLHNMIDLTCADV